MSDIINYDLPMSDIIQKKSKCFDRSLIAELANFKYFQRYLPIFFFFKETAPLGAALHILPVKLFIFQIYFSFNKMHPFLLI